MKFERYSEERLPPQEEIDEAHANMLHEFIQSSGGLRSMILIAVKDLGMTDSVEVACAATSNDMLRAAATLLEALFERVPGEHRNDDQKLELLRKVIDTIYKMAGDSPEGIVKINGDDESQTSH